MEQLQGASNWRMVIRRENGGITLLRARTCDHHAVLPESLFGLPVLALGRHALCPTASPEEGEAVEITCGPGEGSWDNTALEELTLPSSLRRVGDYALYNCRSLRTLRLEDGVKVWGSSALMNCTALADIRLRWEREAQGETLFYFADELNRELEITLEGSSGKARLVFPEYVEIYEENCPAHIFSYNIMGAGYPYHHCFRHRKFSFPEYDALWEDYLAMEHESDTALHLAWWRLRWPMELHAEFRQAYEAYLNAHAGEALNWLLEQQDASGVSFLLKWAKPDRETLSGACAKAREAGETEILAVLLEAQNRRFSRRKTFDL